MPPLSASSAPLRLRNGFPWPVLFVYGALLVELVGSLLPPSSWAAVAEVAPVRASVATRAEALPSPSSATLRPPSLESASAVRLRIAQLREEITGHDRAYYQDTSPEIADADYDELKRRLGELERQFPVDAQAVPPLLEIGDDRTGIFPTHRHRERMMSLGKVYAETELRAFHAKLVKRLGDVDLSYVVEPKYDGLAVSVTYEHGRLVRAVTRGNGVEGDDITAHARLLPGLPLVLLTPTPPAVVEARGEIFVPFAEFIRVNGALAAAGEAPFAHPRNLAAGTLRQLDAREVGRRGLRVVFYGFGACVPWSALPDTQAELPRRFQEWGLPALRAAQVWPAHGVEEMIRAVEACRRARATLDFPTDGAVVKLDPLAGQREVGAGASSPHWAVAYKFPPERAETRLLAITIQVGRTGVLTPVAELAPVLLAGSTIARATLHNRTEIIRRDIRIGDTVIVEKAGEIIPAIVGVNLALRPTLARPFVFPEHCPECRAGVERLGEGALRCPNPSCAAQLRRRLEHLASKAAVDIAGLGPAMIDALVTKGLVADLGDLYRLRREDFLSLGKPVGKSIDHLLAAIEASKRVELSRWIYGLGIPQVGVVAARETALRYRSLAGLLAARPSSTLADQPFLSDGVARALAGFLASPRNCAMISKLIAAGVQPLGPEGAQIPAVAGKVFVLTGTLPKLTRAQAARRIESAGGRVGASVSRATHYVVAGAEAGIKLEQARTLGVAILDERGLLRLLGEE